jgi:hypothetical protein
MAGLGLRAEPTVLTVPAIEKGRYPSPDIRAKGGAGYGDRNRLMVIFQIGDGA